MTAKKHEDALKSDPTMAKLIERKSAASKELLILLKKPGATQEEINGISDRLEEINAEMETAQKALNERGICAKQKGSEYRDEDKKVGWRAAKPKAPDVSGLSADEQDAKQKEYEEKLEQWQKREASDTIVTKHYSKDERQQSQLNVDEQGKFRSSDGQLADGEFGYVMDPDEKKLHRFKENTREQVEAERVKPGTGENAQGQIGSFGR